MKYTAFAVVILGVMIACYAGMLYANDSPVIGQSTDQTDQTPNPSRTVVLSLLGFASMMMCVGGLLWLYGGKGYDIVRLKMGRRKLNTIPDQL